MVIDEKLLRDAIEYQVKFWREKGLLHISDFNLSTLSASLSGYIQGYCEQDSAEIEQLREALRKCSPWGLGEDGESYCELCENIWSEGHADNCEYIKLINA